MYIQLWMYNSVNIYLYVHVCVYVCVCARVCVYICDIYMYEEEWVAGPNAN